MKKIHFTCIFVISFFFMLLINPSITVSAKDTSSSLPSPSGITSERERTEIIINWKQVKGADGYCVYILNKQGDWERYKRVTTNSCTITGLSPDTAYYFKLSSCEKKNNKWNEGKKSGKYTLRTSKFP